MELKVLCDCGQKYAFDVEPIANQMPFAVNCPGCGKDGTATANSILAQTPEVQPAPAKPGGLRISASAPAHATVIQAASLASTSGRSGNSPRHQATKLGEGGHDCKA